MKDHLSSYQRDDIFVRQGKVIKLWESEGQRTSHSSGKLTVGCRNSITLTVQTRVLQ